MEEKTNSFKIRGIKGLWWDGAEKYKNIMHWMPEYQFNFLMLCYTSFAGSGMSWRKGYTEPDRREIREIVQYCNQHNIDLCLGVNPGLWSKPPLLCSGDEDYQTLLNNFLLIRTAGVKWFALCLDDISRELPQKDKKQFSSLAEAHTCLVNRIYLGLKENSSENKLIFCPVTYTTTDIKQNIDYAKYVGENINKDVIFYWTGKEVCSPTITDNDAIEITNIFGNRQILIWDNYPVNDYAQWRLFLAPVKGRSKTLYHHVLGLVSNPMKQSEASKLPLATIGDYLRDPENYDPAISMTKSIATLGKTKIDDVLKSLVDIYGAHFLGEPEFNKLIIPQTKEEITKLITNLKTILSVVRRCPEFRVLYQETAPTINTDIKLLKQHHYCPTEYSSKIN